MAARHLVDYGHRKIAFLSTPITKKFRQKVLAGVRDELIQSGIRFTDSDVYTAEVESESLTGQYEFEVGKQLAKQQDYKQLGYTAIIAINDLSAYGVIQALNQSGVSRAGGHFRDWAG